MLTILIRIMVNGKQDNEFYTLCDELGVVKVIKVGRVRWLGQHFIVQELEPCRKLTLLTPEGTRRVREPKLGCSESVEEM
jgi:hypothetical protein